MSSSKRDLAVNRKKSESCLGYVLRCTASVLMEKEDGEKRSKRSVDR